MSRFDLRRGDCREVLKEFPDSYFSAVVTDPPAGVNFMGKDWDSSRGSPAGWIQWLSECLSECLRVLKPGAHMLVWALPRTSHRTATAIELAGFEIRDRISHLFATGFPKTAKLEKQIDRAMGVAPTVVGPNPNHRPVSGVGYEGVYNGANTGGKWKTEPTSPEAKQWSGWDPSLKPACEDWWLARKPFSGPLYRNVLDHGTGALNIDACRIPTEETLTRRLGKTTESASGWKSQNRSIVAGKDGGRWPAHVIVDELVAEDLGNAGKYFFQAKPSQREKQAGVEGGENRHPTVKSVELMSWLVQLVAPPGAIILDPFCGSGSTGVACARLGINFVGIDLDPEYVKIAGQRIGYSV